VSGGNCSGRRLASGVAIWLAVVCSTVIAVRAQAADPSRPAAPGAAPAGPAQPIPYSHKRHLALGLECRQCHVNPDAGEMMTFLVPGWFGFGKMPYDGTDLNIPEGARVPTYWGQMTMTDAANYTGVIVFFFAIIGIRFKRRSRTTFLTAQFVITGIGHSAH
jgi:hypothetical protein